MQTITYYLMLASFIAHELDAVKRHEWRLLPFLSELTENAGEQVFIWVHVPLFAALFYFGANEQSSTIAMVLSAFSVAHIGLHYFFRNHSQNEFNNASSWTIIIMTGLFGAVHLSLALQSSQT